MLPKLSMLSVGGCLDSLYWSVLFYCTFRNAPVSTTGLAERILTHCFQFLRYSLCIFLLLWSGVCEILDELFRSQAKWNTAGVTLSHLTLPPQWSALHILQVACCLDVGSKLVQFEKENELKFARPTSQIGCLLFKNHSCVYREVKTLPTRLGVAWRRTLPFLVSKRPQTRQSSIHVHDTCPSISGGAKAGAHVLKVFHVKQEHQPWVMCFHG